MNITTIPIRNLRRKLLRTILLIAVFVLGILSMVALNNISAIVGEGLEKKMNQFGANILVYPKSEKLKVSYGGFDLGSMTYDVKYLNESEVVDNIKNIELQKNISSVAPKLLSVARLGEQAVGLVGRGLGRGNADQELLGGRRRDASETRRCPDRSQYCGAARSHLWGYNPFSRQDI